jgi:hypothetical protein
MMPSMDDLHRLEAKGLARAKIRSKRRRVSAIRRRTTRGSLALFAIELEEESAVAQVESEPAPGVEEPAFEAESAPEPEPIVTSAS